jgi:hypothetical protein
VEGEDGRKGVSGQQDDLAADVERYVTKIRSILGFRISRQILKEEEAVASCVSVANVSML